MKITFDPSSIEDYRRFLQVKSLPHFSFHGRTAWVPDEYASRLGMPATRQQDEEFHPIDGLFDYQRDIAAMSIRKRKFAAFVRCGLGKDLIAKEFARHASQQLGPDRCALMITPSMVVNQAIAEAEKFYGRSLPIRRVRASELAWWMAHGKERIGITNYEALNEGIPQGRLGALILDESSMLKSHYGKWGQQCIRLGRGLDWKLALTGTPAPNDRIEYANHAVFLDRYPTVNSFLARFFVNRGQTQNRWELKPHALRPFYRAMSDWCIFLNNPSTYGWKDNCGSIPPIHVHIRDVPLTDDQRRAVMDSTGKLFAGELGGISSRAKMGQLAKGKYDGAAIATNKTGYIADLIKSWPDESTIVWCLYNDEQGSITRSLPGASSITGSTPEKKRDQIIGDFQAGRIKVLVTKPKILGLGLNLQVASRHVFSGLQDSYEQFHQAVSRSNRVGSTKPLNVHIPITEIERPMIDTVLRKAKRIDEETAEQERIFLDASAN